MILLNLLSGVAMLTWGVYITKSGVLRSFGGNLNLSMQKALSSKFWILRALAAGFFTTALVQSSNATAMLVASFLAKGLIKLTPALVIMLGANFGSAIMTRILTFDLSFVSPLFLLIGIILFISKRQSKIGKIGRIFIGLGVILLALKTIVSATIPISHSQNIHLILESLNDQYAFALVFGAILAIICYSSLAAVILTAIVVMAGDLSISTALLIVIGANLGSCALEILGSLGNGIDAKRVMFGNLLFKLSLAVVYLPFIEPISKITYFDNTQDLIIWFHVAFNFSILVIMLPLTSIYSKILYKIFAQPQELIPDESEAKYLDKSVLDNPDLAISNSIREILRLGGFLHQMLNLFEKSVLGITGHSEQIEKTSKTILHLGSKIRKYLNSIDEDAPGHSIRWNQCQSSVIASIQASDLIARMQNEVSYINHSKDINISAKSRSDLIELIKVVNTNLSYSLNALMTKNENDINIVFEHKAKFKELTDLYSINQLHHISAQNDDNATDVTALIMILIADLRQLNGIFTMIAASNLAISEHSLSDHKPMIKED